MTSTADTTDLATLDATAQAELVRSGAVSALELVDAAIARIEALNPVLNAVIYADFERARAAATDVDPSTPFAGVPFLIKDIGATQEGLPYWVGNRLLKEIDHRSTGDTVLGARFRNAGLVTVGKTNLPELGSSPTTQPLSCGPTSNPWDAERSPAGSSGGSAAAVASGMVPIAHANDGGGSTRLPAAWCGLVGLKTTRGRVANPASVSRLVSELVVSRSVRDTARLLDAVEGATPADLFAYPPPERPYVDELGADPGRLRVAVMTAGGQYSVDEECVAGVEATARTLESMGHEIEAVDPDVLLGEESNVNGRLWMAGLARRVEALGEMAGRPLTEDEVEPYNWAAAQRGADLLATEWTATEERQHAWSAMVLDWFANFDVLVTPTAGCPPMTTVELTPPEEKPWRIGRTHGRIGQFTLPFNVTGQPAISLPLHETAAGLPVGVQLVAGMGREDLLIRLAARLEEAMPWHDRRPQVFAPGGER
ncbi:MAG: amidase [Acidimicrobiia bacterium]|nr:amidase [Acidimicrobiia bacterium]